MTEVAYTLRADYEDTYAGGVLNVGDRDFDVAAELADGAGFLVVDQAERGSALLTAVLDDYPPLKRVPAAHAQRARKAAAEPKSNRSRGA